MANGAGPLHNIMVHGMRGLVVTQDLPKHGYVYACKGYPATERGGASGPFYIDAYDHTNSPATFGNHPDADGSNVANGGFRYYAQWGHLAVCIGKCWHHPSRH